MQPESQRETPAVFFRPFQSILRVELRILEKHTKFAKKAAVEAKKLINSLNIAEKSLYLWWKASIERLKYMLRGLQSD